MGRPYTCPEPPPYAYDDESLCPYCDDEFFCSEHSGYDGPVPQDHVHEVAAWVCSVGLSTSFECSMTNLRPLLLKLQRALDATT